MDPGKGKILIMDDEEIVRLVAGDMLKYLGYAVETAQNGDEAIMLCREALKDGKSFQAVILDLSLPGGMGGKEVAKKLAELDPKIKLLASSGYPNDPVMLDCRKYGFDGVVLKPYQIAELGELMATVLQGQSE